MYYPLYSDDKDISSYIPGNDIKECEIYNFYSKIKNKLDNHPFYYDVRLYITNEQIGKNKNGEGKRSYNRDEYYRIFKNKEYLKKESMDKIKRNRITLEDFFNKYISQKLKEDSKGVTISRKYYFDIYDKPIRHQSQIGYRLMNLILYSHLFTNVLFTDKNELFADKNMSYLDYIVGNWNKL